MRRVEELEFDSELWRRDARRADTWTFVTVPPALSAEIRDRAAARPPAGFGSVRVRVNVGTSTWVTSVFPAGPDRYDLPVKKAIRQAQGLSVGDQVRVRLEVLADGVERVAADLMDGRQILDEIKRIVDREHQLRAEAEQGQLDPEIQRTELERLDVALDQCWDLLRQREGRRDAQQDEDDARARPAVTVGNYLQ